MSPEQWMKWRSWLAFYVILPLLVYAGAGLFAFLLGRPFPVEEMLVKGDLLLLVIVLLVTTLDWTMMDMLLAPRTQLGSQAWNQTVFLLTILALFVYTLVYGLVVSSRLPGAVPIARPDTMLSFTVLSLIGAVVFCGAQNLALLRSGRI